MCDRDEFESAVKGLCLNNPLDWSEGEYESNSTQALWDIWRAARAQQAGSGEAVKWCKNQSHQAWFLRTGEQCSCAEKFEYHTRLYTRPSALVPEEFKEGLIELVSSAHSGINENHESMTVDKCYEGIHRLMAMLTTTPQPGGEYENLHRTIETLTKQLVKAEQGSVPEGIAMAAFHIGSKAARHLEEHSWLDPHTGSTEFPEGGQEYYSDLMELAEEIEALAPTTTPQLVGNSGRQGVVVTVCYQEGCSDWEPIFFQKEASDEEIEDSIHEDLYHEIHSNPGFRSYSWKRIKRPNPPEQGAE